MIIPDNYADWGLLARFFTQAHVDDAIMTFKAIEGDPADALQEARAKAWRAYCTINALLEGWIIKDWGSGENVEPDLIQATYDLAQDAVDTAPDADFDVLWAWAYAKMAKLEDDAAEVIRKAIAVCRKQGAEGDNYAKVSLSSLLAEAADILIYQGELDAADAALHEGLYLRSLAGKKGIDWHQWVRALVLFNKALLAEDSADLFVQGNAKNDYEKVTEILEKELSKPTIHPDYEFDCLRVWAAAYWKLGDTPKKDEKLQKFAAKLQNRKPPWSAGKEKLRSRYLTSGPAATLKSKWGEVADALFAE
jgi:hypothetical protein